MFSRRRFITSAAGFATLAAIPAAFSPAAHAAPTINPRFGYSSPSVQLYSLSDSDLNLYMQTARNTGAQIIRFDFRWNLIEGITQGQRNWTEPDRIINAIRTNGMTPLAIINTCPFWASVAGSDPNSENRTPDVAKIQAFKDFVAASATRYKTIITSWEVWNEPNMTKFWPAGPNAQNYTQFLKAAYTEIKKVQPGTSSTVLTAGLASVFSTGGDIAMDAYFTSVYAAGAKGYFDAVGCHPYTWPCDATDPNRPSKAYDGWTKTLAMRDTMVSNGDSAKKLWVTEVGYPTGGTNSVTEAQQAAFLRNTVSGLLAQSFIANVLAYSLLDYGTADNNPENYFGLIRHDRTLKPSYSAMCALNGN